MFKIGSQRLTWIAVKWQGLHDDGSPAENEIQCRVELVDLDELRDQIAVERASGQVGEMHDSLPFGLRCTKDWKEVGDADGNPLAYSTDKFEQLWNSPGFAGAWGNAYLAAWNGQSGIREKNFEASPADGQAAGATKRKRAR